VNATCGSVCRATDNQRCCLRKILSSHEDFKNQKSWLHEVADMFGTRVIHYPRYHCEFNYIEMVWCFLKRQLRRTCKFDYKILKEQLPLALDSIPKDFFHKASDHTFRYMEWYRAGLTGAILEYSMKKFKSHRTISAETAAIVHQEYEEHHRRRAVNVLS
jgi:hypothetical protein